MKLQRSCWNSSFAPAAVIETAVFQKLHRLLVNGKDDATGFAHDAVIGAGGVDAQSAGTDYAVLIVLGASKHQDVLPAGVQVHGHARLLAEANERSGGTMQAVSIEAMNVHAIPEIGPGELILVLQDIEHFPQLDEWKSRHGFRRGVIHRCDA